MRLIGWAISSVVFLVLVAVLGVLGALAYFGRDLPDYSQLADYEPPVTTRLYAGTGGLIAEYAVENRLFVPIAAIPDHVLQAFVSAEDQHFYDHPGVDVLGIVRAAITNIRNIGSNRRLVGASTITQQVAKNFLLTNEVSFTRKIREILLALRIEQTLSKDRILELYLNEIYLGRGSYGVAAAALNYFNRSLPELTLAQAAFLAGLPKAPNNYDPLTQTEAALARRDYVIDRMLEDGAITEADAEAARAEPLEVYQADETEVIAADYFSEEVRRALQTLYGDAALYGGGLTVRTTLEPRLQEIAERTLREGLIAYDRRHGWRGPTARMDGFDGWADRLAEIETPAGAGDWRLAVVLEVTDTAALIGLADGSRGTLPMAELAWARPWQASQRLGPAPRQPADVLTLGDVVLVERLGAPGVAPLARADGEEPEPAYGLRQIPQVQGALVAMDPHTGRVLAMSGGYSYAMSEFNRATQALRQPGSAFKPFVYLAALEDGFTPSSIVLDSPLAVDLGPGLPLWRPSNYSHDFLGPTPMRVGLERSRNVMTVRLLMAVGLEPVQHIAQNFGVYNEMPPLYSMALGAGETTPLRLTTAYAMLANGGRSIQPTFIDRVQDREGRTIFRHDERACAICAETAWVGQVAPNPPDERDQIADPQATFQLVNMMEGVVQRGTAARLRALGIPLAGKTGTTSEYHDAWFVGFTPDLTVGVFVGFDNPRSLGSREAGSAVAVPVFGAFMAEALDGIEVPPFRIPTGLRLVRVDPNTGLPADPGGNFIWEAYRPGTEPNARPLLSVPTTSFGETLPAAIQGTGGLY